jgi:hypothetical protein
VPRSPVAASGSVVQGQPDRTDEEATLLAPGHSLPGVPGPADAAGLTEPSPDHQGQGPAEMRPPPGAVAPTVEGDWLASVCPYLASEDGTYRSAAPDEGHRCTAQEPSATLPLAFQERFCLTDRHPRCEMFKFAHETDASGAIPVAQVPPTDPPSPRMRGGSDGGRPSRPLVVTAAGIGGVILFVLLFVLVMGSCSGDGGGSDDPEATADPQATEEPARTPKPTPKPTPTPDPDPTPEPDPDATPAATDEAEAVEILILYEVQPGEALRKISETFGVSRNRLRKVNPGLEELTPAQLPGEIIEIPIIGDMTLEEAQALEGYLGIAP